MAISSDLQCAYIIFQAIPDSTLNDIDQFLTTVINAAEGNLAIIEAQIISLNIILAPILAKKAAVEAVLTSYQSQAQILGGGLTTGCPALGKVNQQVQDVISNQTAMIKRLMNEINRTQAIRLQYQQYKSILEGYINYLKRVRGLILDVRAARSAAITAANISPGSIITKA